MDKLPIKRIPFYDKKLEGKEYMTEEQVYDLFDGDIVITEKIDGSGKCEGFNGSLFFFEDVKYKHTILYNKLPKDMILRHCQVLLGYRYNGEIHRHESICSPPILFEGKMNKDLVKPMLKELMKLKSQWSNDMVEGIVVANYGKQSFGKISRFDVSGEIDEHWSSKEKINNHSSSIKSANNLEDKE